MTTTTEFQKENLLDLLSKNICEVIFTKVDGTERKMKCTLIPENLPIKEETDNKRNTVASVVAVFDLDKKDWRAFRLDSIKSFTVL